MPPVLGGYQRSWLGPDLVAGVTLAAVAIPECMGYTKIAGTPVVTGLYTILLPVIAFALLGSSRHLVVGADSATAAILFAGLTGLAQPFTGQWLTLASLAALLTAAFLFLSSVLRLGFLANFLSRTVLVGFLSGVGVSLLAGELPDMLGVSVHGASLARRLWETVQLLPHTQMLTALLSLSVLAVVLAIAATWIFRLDHHGIVTIGRVQAGLPDLHFPRVSQASVMRLLPAPASMFLVILAQSAATARSFAQKYGEALDEDGDLVALGAANALAGASGTFVVNGSPTKTAVVDAAGGRTQVAQLATAAVTLAVLLFATGLVARLPQAALAALVCLIGVRLVDTRSLRQIYRFRRSTFIVALATLAAVVFLGVERGIFLAIVLSVLDHLHQEYRPKDVVLRLASGHWDAGNAEPGAQTERGLLVYRFEAPLFFANVDYFSARLQALLMAAPSPVTWLVLDLVSMDAVDYTAVLMLSETLRRLAQQGVTVTLAQAGDVRGTFDRFGITALVGAAHVFETVPDAVDAFHRRAAGTPAPVST